MAKIIPYGDPLAYGKFGGMVFRRYRGATILSTKSRPRYTRTPAQAAVRNKFKNGAKGYNLLTSQSRQFYNARAAQVGICAKDLFMRSYMKGFIPSTIPKLNLKEITKMIIFKTASSKVNGFDIYIEGEEKLPELGEIILWCKMESLTDIQNPSHGPAGAVTGTVTYPVMKFNNGSHINLGSGDIKFPALPANNLHLRGMHGFYWQPSYSSTYGEYAAIWNLPGLAGEDGLFCFFNWINDQIIIEVLRGDSFRIQYQFPITFAANELMHILCLWDTDNPGSRARLWKNGNEITPVILFDNPFTSVDTYSTLNFDNIPVDNWAGYDNIKLYDGVDDLEKALANINNEDPPLGPTGNWIPYAKIEDSGQTFDNLNTIEYETNQRIHIHEKANVGADIPFRYLMTLDYTTLQDALESTSFRLPKLYLAPLSHAYLYLSNDWSDYWDAQYWHLACTDKL